MSKLICKCPKCKASLQFESGDKKELKIHCPKCQHPFQIKVKSVSWSGEAHGATIKAPASHEVGLRPFRPTVHSSADTPFGDLLQEVPPMADYIGPVTVTYRGQPPSAKRTSLKLQKLLLSIAVAVGSIAGVGLIVVGVMWGIQFLPQGSKLSDFASSVSASLPGFDSRGSVEADHASLRARIESLANSIPAGDQSDESAQRLRAELPKFHALFVRACRLPTESKSMQEYVAARDASRAMLDRLRSQDPMGTSTPMVSPFWRVSIGPPANELVTHARNEVTLASASVYSTAMAHLDYPDPMTFAGNELEWSVDDRQVLAFIHLQGCMQRDSLRALAAVDPKTPTASDLAKVHQTIDRYVELAKVVRKHPRKTSSMIAFVPKDNPYESQQRTASVSLMELRKHIKVQSEVPIELDFLFKEVDAFSEVCEGLMFGFQGHLPLMLTTSSTSTDRFKEFLAAEEKKKEDVRKAEIDRQEKEKQKLADETLRRQKSEERQREQEEERKQALEERLANPSTGLGGGSRPGGFGPRPGSMGMPTGPRGDSGQPGFPPGFPGFVAGGSGMPQDRGQPPPASQVDTSRMVTITAPNVKNGNSSDYTRDIPKWLLPHSVSVLISNGNLKITLQNYDKPLTDLESCFPMLVFEKVDNATRTITAKEK